MKKIGIAAVTYKENFGSVLQTYATQYTLEKLGCDAFIFEIKGVHRSIFIKKLLYYAGQLFAPVEAKLGNELGTPKRKDEREQKQKRARLFCSLIRK